MKSLPAVGVVVPSLGIRQDGIQRAIASIASAGVPLRNVLVVSPDRPQGLSPEVGWSMDRGGGLASAINSGIRGLPPDVRYVSWLADDDSLLEGFTDLAMKLESAGNARSFAFGNCTYVDAEGRKLLVSRAGRLATALLRIGPNLIPQPGCLFRRDLWIRAGGLDESLSLAFDLDLFLRLLKFQKALYVNRSVSTFMWHPNSLTGSNREASAHESHKVRLARANFALKAMVLLTGKLVVWLQIELRRLVPSETKGK